MEKESKHTDIINILLTIILIITLIANGVQIYFFKGSDRFDWTKSVISSKGNTVQVSNCDFKGNHYDIDKNKILDDGWNEINDSENVMKDTFIPDSLSIKWFSYNEQKFYGGCFALPKEIIQTNAIQMGMYPSYNDFNSILHFIAEVQPKGKVAVWIEKLDKNDKGAKLKIGTFQAKEITATWHIFDDHPETDKTSDINISKKIALVMEKHPYKVEIKLPRGYTFEGSNFEFFNQNIWSYNSNKVKDPLIFYFLPKQFELQWGNGKKSFSTQFSFDEDEVLDAFRKNNNKSEPLVLELILSDRYNFAKVVLRNNKTNSEIVFKDKY